MNISAGARWGCECTICWSPGIFETSQQFLWLTEDGPERRKCPISGGWLEENTSLMSGVRGQIGQTGCSPQNNNSTSITAGSNKGLQNSLSDCWHTSLIHHFIGKVDVECTCAVHMWALHSYTKTRWFCLRTGLKINIKQIFYSQLLHWTTHVDPL